MTSVHFEIHRFTTDVEELDEQALERLLASDAEFVASLCKLDGLDGALVIDDASIVDDLSSATQRLCFEAIEALVAPGTTYKYQYFTSNSHAALVSSADGATIALSGDDVPARDFSRAALFPALYACGLRYLAFLEESAAAAGHRACRTSRICGRSRSARGRRSPRTASHRSLMRC